MGRRGALTGTLALAERNLSHAGSPRSVVTMVVVPAVFFGGFYGSLANLLRDQALAPEQFLPPAILVQSLMFVAVGTGVLLASDRSTGVYDRFRSLPIGSAAVPTARLMMDVLRLLAAIAIVLVLGFAVGFRFDGGVPEIGGFVAIALLFGLTLAIGAGWLGLATANPESVSALLNLPVLVFFMLSAAVVPEASFPAWFQPIVSASPVTAVVEALRALAEGSPEAVPIWRVTLWLGSMMVIFSWGAVRAFRRTR